MNNQWRPTADINTLRARAAIISAIRDFFTKRAVLEVETPALSRYSVTDPYLQALSCIYTKIGSSESEKLYLQTSPEYAMKRLLAAGSGDIFQISKAFRRDEVGHQHNPEFSMLEWYRVGFTMQQLVDEVSQLLIKVLPVERVEQTSYKVLFEQYLNIDPLCVELEQLKDVCSNNKLQSYTKSCEASFQGNQDLLTDSLLQVLFNQCIEPHIGQQVPMIVSDFPASQASLATLSDDKLSAKRFEVYFKNKELANGFEELTDAKLQVSRFEQDNQNRKAMGLPEKAIDKNFIAALEHGLPSCSGVAMGIDRLIMLALDKANIADVISFSNTNC